MSNEHEPIWCRDRLCREASSRHVGGKWRWKRYLDGVESKNGWQSGPVAEDSTGNSRDPDRPALPQLLVAG